MDKNDVPIYDVIIVGAGLSGIGAAYHLLEKCPGKSFMVLEARSAIGGTWDFFKYPGIRSDSDMYTMGFSFNPWEDPKAIADGPSILQYIKDTARKFGIDKKIQFDHKVVEASWSDLDKRWTLQIAYHERVKHKIIKCAFLFMCSGYYNYEQGHAPAFKNSNSFSGTIIHPQQWDPSLSYDQKKVVVIGSGATAITLVPELAKKAAKVVMLQRSPTYIVNLPSEDVVANFLKKVLPSRMAYFLSRWKNILFSLGFYKAARKWPNFIRKHIQKGIQKELGEAYEKQHFDPMYNPWDQRLCLVPDSDLFAAIKSGKAEVVTDTIKQFTENGIQISSGEVIDADIIVTATGLKIQLMGGMVLKVNGKTIDSGSTHCYRGVLLSDVPNFAVTVGYTNATWTLKCDLNCHFVTRLLNHMDKNNYQICIPRFDSEVFASEPLLDFDSGYIQRALDILPMQGSKSPWKVYQNYLLDTVSLKYSKLNDDYLEYE